MVIDEIGYLPITRTGVMLFFQLLTRRYEHASTILTSNKGFEEWGEIFGDEVMAAALIDRLVHHCHIVNIRGNSYRLRQHAELARRLHTSPPPGNGTAITPTGDRHRLGLGPRHLSHFQPVVVSHFQPTLTLDRHSQFSIRSASLSFGPRDVAWIGALSTTHQCRSDHGVSSSRQILASSPASVKNSRAPLVENSIRRDGRSALSSLSNNRGRPPDTGTAQNAAFPSESVER